MLNSIKISLVVLLFSACSSAAQKKDATPSVKSVKIDRNVKVVQNDTLETATLAGGCFWKMDACYQQLNGVTQLAVGYAGGTKVDPTYEEVSSDRTGHAETIQVIFNPKIVSYKEILNVFWDIHDATRYNREGNDVGADYRSAVFFHSPQQEATAQAVKDSLDKSGTYSHPLVTEITAFTNFYKAEAYHQDYYNLNPNEPYTSSVVREKVTHFEDLYKAKLKK